MTKGEALKLAIDGQKVRHWTWNAEGYEYIYFYKHKFLYNNKIVFMGHGDLNTEGWEIYQEPKNELQELAEYLEVAIKRLKNIKNK